MSESERRKLERRWRGDRDNEAAFSALVQSCRRTGVALPRDVLAWTDRWRALTKVLENFYVRPPSPEDDASEAMAAAKEKLGYPVPSALEQWYTLVGGRLHTAWK